MRRNLPHLLLSFLVALSAVGCTLRSPAEKLLSEQDNPHSHSVMVIAHRGDWRGAPENSLAGFANCIDMGVDMIELDVRRTKDGGLVVMHDESVDRTTNGKGRVSSLTTEEVTQLRLRNALGRITEHCVPTLEEALLVCKDRVLIHLDKGQDLFEQLYELTERTETTAQVMFKSSRRPSAVRERYGDLIDKIPYVPVITFGEDNMEEWVDEIIAHKPVAVECVFSEATPDVLTEIERLKESGVKICIGTMWASACGSHDDDRAVSGGAMDDNWGWVVRRGALQIMTDRPMELLNYLRARGWHK